MILQHITESICSCCGARVCREEQKNLHTNGCWNERRVFECGREVYFSPNWMKILVHNECSHHPTVVERTRKIKDGKQKIVQFIKELDIPDDYRKSLLANLGIFE